MDRLKDGLGFLLADVSRLARRAFEQRIEGSSLTHAQARALVYLSRSEGLRQVELAELLDVQPITLTRLVDQLADTGLVERRPDPADRRAHQLFLTAAARAHLMAIEEVALSIRTDALRGIDAHQAAILLAVLRKMRDNLARR
ncbi:MAG: MarR family winged helix-turn-helix transcriptional regulator [Gammaproteobacteria bacterium]|uniref:MarR family winged helix-turn-helix transcriptional regulator n=1 Tax=Bradyrhizobium sp. TaxID=376 RepID=UPI003D14BF08